MSTLLTVDHVICQPCDVSVMLYVLVCQLCALLITYSVQPCTLTTMGAGPVEKGRQIAGIILDSWARGRRKHVWFRSASRNGEGCIGPGLGVLNVVVSTQWLNHTWL